MELIFNSESDLTKMRKARFELNRGLRALLYEVDATIVRDFTRLINDYTESCIRQPADIVQDILNDHKNCQQCQLTPWHCSECRLQLQKANELLKLIEPLVLL